MAFKLTKQEDAQRAAIGSKLTLMREALDAKVEAVNEAVETAVGALEDAVREYNEVLEEARGFVTDIVSVAQEDFNDKSERWQEGERGEQAQEWISEWESADLDDVEMPTIEPVALDVEDHADVLDALPDEAAF